MRRKIFLGILCICICLLWGKTEVFATETPEVQPTISESQQLYGEVEDTQTESRVIKVGWFECDGYYEKDQKNNLIGFGVDYLNAIAAYTGWEYEYVEGTREECLVMLQNGEIDLMSPVRIDLELQNAKLSDEVIGESYGYIYKLGNNFKVSYEEYSKFKRMIIGIEKRSFMEEEIKSYCMKNGFEFYDIVYFEIFS